MKKVLFLLMLAILMPMTVFGYTVSCDNPDIKVKVVSCNVAGKDCYVEILLTNVGPNDYQNLYVDPDKAYDDMGILYDRGEHVFRVKELSGNFSSFPAKYPLLEGTSVRLTFKLENVLRASSEITRMDIILTNQNQKTSIKIKNLPIYRE